MRPLLRATGILVALLGPTGPGQAATKLASIFQFDMLNAQLAYLENITGPAMHIHADESGVEARDYRVEGCKIIAYVKGREVLGYSLVLNRKCQFNLGGFLGNGYASTEGMTVGKFGRGAFGPNLRVQASCISLCGNAADPTVNFTWEGPHAVNFVSVVLTVTLVDDRALAAAERWRGAMEKNEGEEYVLATKFNCDPKYDALGIKFFADVPVTEITIGFYEPDAEAYKKSCDQ